MGRIYRFRPELPRYGEQQKEEYEMRIEGMPETFWIVTMPTVNSELGDICFQCDFRQFALQIRGGLKIEEIVGVFADGEVARETATRLLAGRDVEESDSVIHPSIWPEWFATQEHPRSVSMCDRASDAKVEVQPPATWGKIWAWNLTEDGTGIVLRRIS
jgi:hypothetical protein